MRGGALGLRGRCIATPCACVPWPSLLALIPSGPASDVTWHLGCLHDFRYVLSNIETKQGVRRGDRVWQVRCCSFPAAVLPSGVRGFGTEIHAAGLNNGARSPKSCQASLSLPRLTSSSPMQIAFGSGFKCNSAVWRALRNINDRHEVWLEDGGSCSSGKAVEA